MIKIVDNYFDDRGFNKVYNLVHGDIKWEFYPKLNDNATSEHHFQFMHNLIDQYGHIRYEDAEKASMFIMKPLVIREKRNVVVVRSRLNMYVKTTHKHEQMGYHKDVEEDEDHMVLLLYMEDSNGYTEFKTGEKVMSKRNRVAIFPAHVEHQTVSQTDTLFRYNININYAYI